MKAHIRQRLADAEETRQAGQFRVLQKRARQRIYEAKTKGRSLDAVKSREEHDKMVLCTLLEKRDTSNLCTGEVKVNRSLRSATD